MKDKKINKPKNLIAAQRSSFSDLIGYLIAGVILTSGFASMMFPFFAGTSSVRWEGLFLISMGGIMVLLGIGLAVRAVLPLNVKIYENGYVYREPSFSRLGSNEKLFVRWEDILWVDLVEIPKILFNKEPHYGFVIYRMNEKGKVVGDLFDTGFFKKGDRFYVLKKILKVREDLEKAPFEKLPNVLGGMQVKPLSDDELEILKDKLEKGSIVEFPQRTSHRIMGVFLTGMIFLLLIIAFFASLAFITVGLQKTTPLSFVYIGLGAFSLLIGIFSLVHIYQETK